MKKISLLAIGVIIGLGIAFVLIRTSVIAPTADLTPSPSVSPSTTPTPSATAQQLNITIASPKAGQKVTVPFTVTGTERTFEQSVNWQIRTTNGTVLASGYTTGNAPELGVFGPYSFTVDSLTVKGSLELWVFEYSAKDGSIINLVKVPITVQ